MVKPASERRLADLVHDNLPYLENLIIEYGHESGLLRTHPAPCTGHDFCLMRQAKKGADAIRAALSDATRTDNVPVAQTGERPQQAQPDGVAPHEAAQVAPIGVAQKGRWPTALYVEPDKS